MIKKIITRNKKIGKACSAKKQPFRMFFLTLSIVRNKHHGLCPWLFIIIFIFSLGILQGCLAPVQRKTAVIPKKKIDDETVQKVEKILKRVENISKNKGLEFLGRSTMSESVELMDMGVKVCPVLVSKLKISKDWKLRFWLVDLLGYIPSRENIIPLVEVIEDSTEKEITRLRACDSLKELNYTESIEHLLIAKDIVKNEKLKQKIEETIERLKR
jgi:hypothetical protein